MLEVAVCVTLKRGRRGDAFLPCQVVPYEVSHLDSCRSVQSQNKDVIYLGFQENSSYFALFTLSGRPI